MSTYLPVEVSLLLDNFATLYLQQRTVQSSGVDPMTNQLSRERLTYVSLQLRVQNAVSAQPCVENSEYLWFY